MADSDRKSTANNASSQSNNAITAQQQQQQLTNAFELAVAAAQLDPVTASAMLGSAGYLYNPGYSQLAAAAAAFSGSGSYGLQGVAAALPGLAGANAQTANNPFGRFSGTANADPFALAYAQSAAAYGLMPSSALRTDSMANTGNVFQMAQSTGTTSTPAATSSTAQPGDKEPQESFSEVLAKLGQGLSSSKQRKSGDMTDLLAMQHQYQQQQQQLAQHHLQTQLLAQHQFLYQQQQHLINATLKAASTPSTGTTNTDPSLASRRPESRGTGVPQQAHTQKKASDSSPSRHHSGSLNRKTDSQTAHIHQSSSLQSKRTSSSTSPAKAHHHSSSSYPLTNPAASSANLHNTSFRSPPPRCSSAALSESSSLAGCLGATDESRNTDSPGEGGKGGSTTTGRGRGRPPKLYAQRLAQINAQMQGMSDTDRVNLQLKMQLEAEFRKQQRSPISTTSPQTQSVNLSRASGPRLSQSPLPPSGDAFASTGTSRDSSTTPGGSREEKKVTGELAGSRDLTAINGVASAISSSNKSGESKKSSIDCSIEGTIDFVLKSFEEADRAAAAGAAIAEHRSRPSHQGNHQTSREDSIGAKKRKHGLEKTEQSIQDCKKSKTVNAETNCYKLPLQLGWKRETLVKGVGPGGILGEVVYITPCQKKLWNMDNVREYLAKVQANSVLSTDDFTFKSYIRLGDYYESSKLCPSRQSYLKMDDKAVDDLIQTASGTPCKKREPPPAHSGSGVVSRNYSSMMDHNSNSFTNDSKTFQTTQKTSAEEKEAKQRELAEVERKRQYAYLLNMERERQRQYSMFAQVMEQQKKLEEKTKERLQKQREEELEKQRKLEARIIEQRISQELKRPNEDMCLADSRPLPDLKPLEGNKLSCQVLGDCLMMIEFLHSFCDALCIDVKSIPTIGTFQGAFIDKNESCVESITTVLVELLKFAVCDPGIPNPRIVQQMLGLRFSDLEITGDTVSNVLRMFIVARNGFEDDLSDWLSGGTQIWDLIPHQQGALMAFMCHELLASRLISGDVDRNIEQQALLRREKWLIDAKIKKLKNIQARKFNQLFQQPQCPSLQSTTNNMSNLALPENSENEPVTTESHLVSDATDSIAPTLSISSACESEKTFTTTLPENSDSSNNAYVGSKLPTDTNCTASGPVTVMHNGGDALDANSSGCSTPVPKLSPCKSSSAFATPSQLSTPPKLERELSTMYLASNVAVPVHPPLPPQPGDEDSGNESDETHLTGNLSGDEEDIACPEDLERRIDRLVVQSNAKQTAIQECGHRLRHTHLGQDRFRRNYFVLGRVGGVYVEGLGETEEEEDFDADKFITELRQRKELAARKKAAKDSSSKHLSNSSTLLPGTGIPKKDDIELNQDTIVPDEIIDEEKNDDKVSEVVLEQIDNNEIPVINTSISEVVEQSTNLESENQSEIDRLYDLNSQDMESDRLVIVEECSSLAEKVDQPSTTDIIEENISVQEIVEDSILTCVTKPLAEIVVEETCNELVQPVDEVVETEIAAIGESTEGITVNEPMQTSIDPSDSPSNVLLPNDVQMQETISDVISDADQLADTEDKVIAESNEKNEDITAQEDVVSAVVSSLIREVVAESLVENSNVPMENHIVSDTSINSPIVNGVKEISCVDTIDEILNSNLTEIANGNDNIDKTDYSDVAMKEEKENKLANGIDHKLINLSNGKPSENALTTKLNKTMIKAEIKTEDQDQMLSNKDSIDVSNDTKTFHDFLNGCIQTCIENFKIEDPAIGNTSDIEKYFTAGLDLTTKQSLGGTDSTGKSLKPALLVNSTKPGGNSRTNPDEPLDLSLRIEEEEQKVVAEMTKHVANLKAERNNSNVTKGSANCKIDDALISNAALIYASQASSMCPGVPVTQLQQFYKEQLTQALEDHSTAATTENVRAWMSFYQSMLVGNCVGTKIGGDNGSMVPWNVSQDQTDMPAAGVTESERGSPEPSITEEEIEAAVHKDMVAKGYELEEKKKIPNQMKSCWWRIGEESALKDLIMALANRGIREKALSKAVTRCHEDVVLPSLSVNPSPVLTFDIPEKPARLKVRSKRGKSRGSSSGTRRDSILNELPEESTQDETFVSECKLLEEIEALEDKVLNASLQTKGWQAPLKIVDDDTIHLVPRTSKKKSRFEHHPLDVVRDRLSALELHMERRYLLPPLNREPHLDLVGTSQPPPPPVVIEEKSLDTPETSSLIMECDETSQQSSSTTITTKSTRPQRLKRQETETEDEDNLPLGLIQWRQTLAKTVTADQARACLDQLIKAVAWDKSIMKVLCQICRKDNNEAQLLLCDGCDRGYHTYCFRPVISQIPTGDWFCFDCISKATGKRHCFVCGLLTGQHPPPLPTPPQSASTTVPQPPPVTPSGPSKSAVCDLCSRMIHLECAKPPMNRTPRKWLCAVCSEASASRQQSAANAVKGKTQTPPVSSAGNKRARPSVSAAPSAKLARSSSCSGVTISSSSSLNSIIASITSTENSLLSVPLKLSSLHHGSIELSSFGEPSSTQTYDAMPCLDDTLASVTAEYCGSSAVDGCDSSSVASSSGHTDSGGVSFAKKKSRAKSSGRHPSAGQASNAESDGVTSSMPTNPTLDGQESNSSCSAAAGPAVTIVPMSETDADVCRSILDTLSEQDLSWPFLKPVNAKQVPFYKKVIKTPMDFSTIRKNISDHRYKNKESFAHDVRLVFDNCEVFNEDDSAVGKAGHDMRALFESQWSNQQNQSSPKPSNIPVFNSTSLDCSSESSHVVTEKSSFSSTAELVNEAVSQCNSSNTYQEQLPNITTASLQSDNSSVCSVSPVSVTKSLPSTITLSGAITLNQSEVAAELTVSSADTTDFPPPTNDYIPPPPPLPLQSTTTSGSSSIISNTPNMGSSAISMSLVTSVELPAPSTIPVTPHKDTTQKEEPERIPLASGQAIAQRRRSISPMTSGSASSS